MSKLPETSLDSIDQVCLNTLEKIEKVKLRTNILGLNVELNQFDEMYMSVRKIFESDYERILKSMKELSQVIASSIRLSYIQMVRACNSIMDELRKKNSMIDFQKQMNLIDYEKYDRQKQLIEEHFIAYKKMNKEEKDKVSKDWFTEIQGILGEIKKHEDQHFSGFNQCKNEAFLDTGRARLESDFWDLLNKFKIQMATYSQELCRTNSNIMTTFSTAIVNFNEGINYSKINIVELVKNGQYNQQNYVKIEKKDQNSQKSPSILRNRYKGQKKVVTFSKHVLVQNDVSTITLQQRAVSKKTSIQNNIDIWQSLIHQGYTTIQEHILKKFNMQSREKSPKLPRSIQGVKNEVKQVADDDEEEDPKQHHQVTKIKTLQQENALVQRTIKNKLEDERNQMRSQQGGYEGTVKGSISTGKTNWDSEISLVSSTPLNASINNITNIESNIASSSIAATTILPTANSPTLNNVSNPVKNESPTKKQSLFASNKAPAQPTQPSQSMQPSQLTLSFQPTQPQPSQPPQPSQLFQTQMKQVFSNESIFNQTSAKPLTQNQQATIFYKATTTPQISLPKPQLAQSPPQPVFSNQSTLQTTPQITTSEYEIDSRLEQKMKKVKLTPQKVYQIYCTIFKISDKQVELQPNQIKRYGVVSYTDLSLNEQNVTQRLIANIARQKLCLLDLPDDQHYVYRGAQFTFSTEFEQFQDIFKNALELLSKFKSVIVIGNIICSIVRQKIKGSAAMYKMYCYYVENEEGNADLNNYVQAFQKIFEGLPNIIYKVPIRSEIQGRKQDNLKEIRFGLIKMLLSDNMLDHVYWGACQNSYEQIMVDFNTLIEKGYIYPSSRANFAEIADDSKQ